MQKNVGKVQAFDAHPPFALIKTIDSGPTTKHVRFEHNSTGTCAYITVGDLIVVKVFLHQLLLAGRQLAAQHLALG